MHKLNLIFIVCIVIAAVPYIFIALAYWFVSKDRGTFETVVSHCGVFNPANRGWYFSPALINRHTQTVLVRPEFFSRKKVYVFTPDGMTFICMARRIDRVVTAIPTEVSHAV